MVVDQATYTRQRHGNLFWTQLYLPTLLLLVDLVGGSIPAADAGRDGLGLGGLKHVQSSASRQLLQEQEADVSASDGVFATITPCKDLMDILTTTPPPNNTLGNFTEKATGHLLRECSLSHSLYQLTGDALAHAFKQPTPMVKLVTMSPSSPIVWPAGTSAPRFAPGSVNIVDCQDQALDFRSWPVDAPPEEATIIYLRCLAIFPDSQVPIATQNWNVHTAISFPCEGTSDLSKSGHYPRSNPRVFPELTAPLSTISTGHVINMTVWCWTEQDIEQLYSEDEQEGSKGKVNKLAVGLGSVAAVVLVCVVLATTWVCCGRPCCRCYAPKDRTAQHTEQQPPNHIEDLAAILASFRSAAALPATVDQHMAIESSTRNDVPPPPPIRNPTAANPTPVERPPQRVKESRHRLPAQPERDQFNTGTAHEHDPDRHDSMPSANARSSAVHSTAPSTDTATNSNLGHAFCDAPGDLTIGSSQYHSVVDHERTRSSGSDINSMTGSPAATPAPTVNRTAIAPASTAVVAAAWEAGEQHLQERNHLHSLFTRVGPAGLDEAPRMVVRDNPLVGLASHCSTSKHSTASGGLEASKAEQEEARRILICQLDTLIGKDIIDERGTMRVLDGHYNRLEGGQAVVQIVEDTTTSEKYAIKFFFSKDAFRQEKSFYVDPTLPLGKFLPRLLAIAKGEEKGLRDANGDLMPPCIIMEMGEALDVWVEKSGSTVDFVTGLQVLYHIAERLIDLHSAGYVHRDLKPGNIMWLPRNKRWTLIDFGCAARTGSHAPTGFSLFYAAPEALRAYNDSQHGLVATEALDAWSLGVLAIELLTGKSMFGILSPRDEVRLLALIPGDIFRAENVNTVLSGWKQCDGSRHRFFDTRISKIILGEILAPWEDPDTANSLLRPLGIFKAPILSLLARDASKRSTIHTFQQACLRVLSNTSITSR